MFRSLTRASLPLRAIIFVSAARLAQSAPDGFPKSGNGLWYTTVGVHWSKEWLPIGNGYLAAMVPGGTAQEVTQLNLESLWSGGPFQDPTYNGGNKLPSERPALAEDMQDIRQSIFQSPGGTIDNVEELASDAGAYGSYAGAGFLLSNLNVSGPVSDYGRWLDLDEAVARTRWTQSNITFVRESFCSHPAQACVQHISTVTNITLPTLTYSISAALEAGLPIPNVTCFDNATLQLRGLVSDPGMEYELLAQVHTTNGSVSCAPIGIGNATLSVEHATEAWIVWVGGTEYDLSAGDVAHKFSFKGADPHDALLALLTPLASSNYDALLSAHTTDYESVVSPFALDLGQKVDLDTPTDALVLSYETDTGNPYLEWLLFNYGRYLLTGSARGILPANLQGKWANGISNPWSADYHSNINIQMNYWFAEMTNMNLVTPLFDYIEMNWAPRGSQTAEVLYNITRGFVTHNEIFGHTGMKASGNSAQWADYPESAVWMMIHVWDHFDYTNDVSWWKAQGWPLLKGVASFHLDKLITDLYFNDSTLVTAPCNSPEQVPITFGCAHAQQLIWQLLNAVEKGFAASGDSDTAFLQEVRTKRTQMDKGIRIGSWGQLQEWKVDMDSPTDTHRHLSHLVGLYPGYALASYDPSVQPQPKNHKTYSKSDVVAATTTSLIHRGNGTGPDADAGWEKVWRAAGWAQLGNASAYYHQLTYAVERNYGTNLFSLYDPLDDDPIFQIDANFGYPAAVLNALLQAPDVASTSIPLVITLLPALPEAWSSGSLKGAKVRGGIAVDLQWKSGRLTTAAIRVNLKAKPRQVKVVYGGRTITSFNSFGGYTVDLTF